MTDRARSVLELADGRVQAEPVRMMIDGRWVAADDGASFGVLCPATGEPMASVAGGGPAETRRAIEAAARAFPEWRARAPEDRGSCLLRASELILGHREELARLLAREEGKPLTEARGEIDYAAGFLTFFAEEAERIFGESAAPGVPGKRILIPSQPIGVAGLLTIWNFPAAGVTRPAGAALAAGCTVVVKPAEQTPLTAVALFELLAQAGLPPGAANLVTTADPAPVGRELVQSPLVPKLSFTGSTEIGRLIAREAAPHLKRVTLELGGHAPFIVFEDADLDAAVEGAVRSKFRNNGQTCVCLNRIYAHAAVFEPFAERFLARVGELRVGDPLDERTRIGPLIDSAGLRKVAAHVEDAVSRGATVLHGGARITMPGLEGGLYFEPTVLRDLTPEMLIMREETFGPVAPLVAFHEEDEVVAAANGVPWGLAAFAFTRDQGRASRLAERLDYGVVGINDPLPAAPQLPFGGLKQSGLGKEGGRLGIEEFLDTKLVSMVP